MSFDTEFYTLERFSDQSLSVMQCGYHRCHSGHLCETRFYEYRSVTFILQGKGIYRIGDRAYELHAGQGFLIEPNISISYQADKEDPWHYIYVIFCGSDGDALIRNAGLGNGRVVFDYPQTETMRQDLFVMHDSIRTDASKGYRTIGYFYLVMSRLVQTSVSETVRKNSTEQYLTRAVSYIEDHYLHHINADDVARSVNLDRTYLYRIFMTHLGYSPAAYIRQCKLKKSLELMERDDMTLSEIAVSSGFYDLSHLNRIFSESYGISPQQYKVRRMQNR